MPPSTDLLSRGLPADVTIREGTGVISVVTPDDELVLRLRAGEEAACEELVARYHASSLRFATRQLGDRADAEEAVQDAFLRAVRSLRNGFAPHNLRSWLMRIVVNRCRTAAARRARRRRLQELWFLRRPDEASGSAPSEELTPELPAGLRSALASLSPPLREAFLLKHVEEMTYPEIAAVTGASVSALKMRVKRAHEHLLQCLRGENERDRSATR